MLGQVKNADTPFVLLTMDEKEGTASVNLSKRHFKVKDFNKVTH